MWGIRVIIPTKLRNKVLNELHAGHVGIVKNERAKSKFLLVGQDLIVALNS